MIDYLSVCDTDNRDDVSVIEGRALLAMAIRLREGKAYRQLRARAEDDTKEVRRVMQRTMLRAKLHRVTGIDANVDYEGSVATDATLMEAASDIRIREG